MPEIAGSRRLLRLADLCKSREGIPILEKVGLEVSAGQACGLIGDNRDGLSLLIDIISGAESEDSGLVALGSGKGEVVHLGCRDRLRRVGVARERPRLVDKLSVLDNVFLGSLDQCSRFGVLSESLMRRKASGALRQLEARVPLGAQLSTLDPASRTLVDIARTMLKECDCLIFDSVTRTMSAWQYEAFADLVRALKAQGRAVVIVPVSAEDVRTFADRLYLLSGGQLKEIERARELRDDELNALFLHGDKSGLKHINDPIYKARLRIEERLEEGDLDFKEVAGSVFMSYDNFRRKFKLQVGLSPNQYFIKLKVERAKELLLFTDFEIKDIAEKLGFSDPYYFSRVFKEWEGQSPLRFRGKKAS
jgi:ribose transport system ATP-binding protein